MLVSRISQLIAFAASTANSTALRFSTGSAPGSPRQVGQICVFGSPPYLFTQPQNAFDSVKKLNMDLQPDHRLVLGKNFGRKRSRGRHGHLDSTKHVLPDEPTAREAVTS